MDLQHAKEVAAIIETLRGCQKQFIEERDTQTNPDIQAAYTLLAGLCHIGASVVQALSHAPRPD